MKQYGGKAIFIDRDNINTDEIIPAKYLTEIEKSPLKSHLLEDLKLEGFDRSSLLSGEYSVVISRSNFGSGSSREMAVWAFEVNGINTIIASNFARIFRENAFYSGILAIELGLEEIDDLFTALRTYPNIQVDVNLEEMKLTFTAEDFVKELSMNLSSFERDVIAAGGWIELAAQKY